MSKLGDIAAPSLPKPWGGARMLLLPLALVVLWALAAPFLHGSAVPSPGLAAAR